MERQPFDPTAQTKEALEASRSPEFIDLEIRALKGGGLRGGGPLGAKPLSVDEMKVVQQYVDLHKTVGNSHVEGYDDLDF